MEQPAEIAEKFRPHRDTSKFIKKQTDLSKFVDIQSNVNCLIFLNFREESSEVRLSQIIENDAIDTKYGFDRVRDTCERTGFLLNMHPVCKVIC